MFTEDIDPKPGETRCVTPRCKKTASLLFDRVWDAGEGRHGFEITETTFGDVPNEIRFYRGITALAAIADAPHDNQTGDKRPVDVIRLIAKYTGCVAVYPKIDDFEREFKKGSYDMVVMALEKLRLVDEDNLTWDQVLEFRKDVESRKKYIRLHNWLNSALTGKTQREVEDTLWLKLQDYEAALKKHGLKTVLGEVRRVLDPKVLFPTAGTGLAVASIANPLLGALAGGSIALCNLVVRLWEMKLQYDDVKNGQHSEIAIIYEIGKAR